MSNLWKCPRQPCLLSLWRPICTVSVFAIDRCWLISWSGLGYVSRFLHSNDIPHCVCFPPVFYSFVQRWSACLPDCRPQLFLLPFLSNWSDEPQKVDECMKEKERLVDWRHLTFSPKNVGIGCFSNQRHVAYHHFFTKNESYVSYQSRFRLVETRRRPPNQKS